MNLWTGAAELLFPSKCPFCREILETLKGLFRDSNI